MLKKSVLLTGGTSFTGCHIARALHDEGFEVVASLTKAKSSYQDSLVKKRMDFSKVTEWVAEAPFGSDSFLNLCRQKTFVAFINHGSDIRGYRLPTFNYLQSLSSSLNRAPEVMSALATNSCGRVIHSGSVFEPDEGTPSAGEPMSSPALSIYGVCKAMTWQGLRYFAEQVGLNLSKIVIPNPIGAFENADRLFPTLYRKWLANETAQVFGPELVRDHLPAPWLARLYVEEVKLSSLERSLKSSPQNRVLRPSGMVLKNLDLVGLFAHKLKESGFAKDCSFEIKSSQNLLEPLIRVNREPVNEFTDLAAQNQFWTELHRALADLNPLKPR